MARKDDIFISFIKHPIIQEQYGLDEKDLPPSLSEGERSENYVVRAIAMIVKSQEALKPESEKALRNSILQFLNDQAL